MKEAADDINGIAATPVSENLFEVNKVATSLDEADSKCFHRMTAQLLFARKRAQPGIQVAVAFLCTQVKVPNVDDYKNLTCVIKYLRGTIHLQMMIGWDKTVTLT